MRLARERTLGELRAIEASFGFPIGTTPQWRLDRALAGGGPLMDVGIYLLQSARLLTGEEPTHVSAVETKTDPRTFREVEETMTFQLTFPGGVLADCATTYKVPGMNRVVAFADRGTFGLEPAYNYGGNRGWRSDGAPLRFEQIDQFAAELDDFARCILEERPTKVPGEEGLKDVRVLMATYESAKLGRRLPL
ncbi:MAG TPA: Gfo/Idh/MocA family oxidoreductase [Gemmatimonadaceae bacterium]|nr:Gfo/Idh/MocA family oxidoreductase [Gemmatimonadaceae bacterium]